MVGRKRRNCRKEEKKLCSYGLQAIGTPLVTQLDHIYLDSEKMLSFPGVKNSYISLPTPIIRLS
jgi:hypothetical protein